MLIKSVKSVQASKRKVYMLYDLTPDESVTGGAWYSDQDFESEFVDVLNQHCLKFLQQKAFKAQATHKDPIARRTAALASSNEVCRFITELGISKVRFGPGNEAGYEAGNEAGYETALEPTYHCPCSLCCMWSGSQFGHRSQTLTLNLNLQFYFT